MRPVCPADLDEVAGIFGWYAVNSPATFEELPRPHLACGFTQAGRLTAVGFKHGRWNDTRLMQRVLGTDAP